MQSKQSKSIFIIIFSAIGLTACGGGSEEQAVLASACEQGGERKDVCDCMADKFAKNVTSEDMTFFAEFQQNIGAEIESGKSEFQVMIDLGNSDSETLGRVTRLGERWKEMRSQCFNS
ncbi:MAG: hypothetical protein ACFBZ9_16600 [Sphingomonadales bacterium]